MADIIQLLPDSIANQIAAGEVVQRPSSIVKELLENAIDAGATEIQLILKDAGKTLIQVVDNGKGMSETDARMCFERHATSKIRNTEDLFSIQTMGFRGEALASIAAVAKVDLITRTADKDIAINVRVEGTKVTRQEACQGPLGTSISIKNLFYNVPARRKFLKSDPTEYKHALDEFNRIVLSYPEIKFTLYHNNNNIMSLSAGNLRQRIVSVLGKSINDKLVPVEVDTDNLILSGFIGKPEASKKSRGDQYLFVNKRFIKSNYINHAIKAAYEDLIASDHTPVYFLFLEIDPTSIDVNVHPTKQEIKFEEERLIYNYIKVAVRHALGQYNITPVLDFSRENTFDHQKHNVQKRMDSGGYGMPEKSPLQKDNLKNWESIYEGMITIESDEDLPVRVPSSMPNDDGPLISTDSLSNRPYQIHNKYIINPIKSGFLIIDQKRATERIYYEEFMESVENQEVLTQKKLFPKPIELSSAKAETLRLMKNDLSCMGLEIEEFGKDDFIIHALPAGIGDNIDETVLIEELITQYEANIDMKLGLSESVAASVASKKAIRGGTSLSETEMHNIIDRLFACKIPYTNAYGNKTFITVEIDELKKRFNS
ncbi:DNA mismatch repair endonuclease MutL [Portibacter lacus]|uniref:DNA mismatch repair protein MutL n=1 Tax=Portibacter lacus TaxID=1099794 RepID=A0AA37SPR6_9BACT|nr:DNA mismatch repair endonuclease MutL [Portibacter lacus]GLR17912.1 DNA mismatch repair protein MutL [Portibacter lacus]